MIVNKLFSYYIKYFNINLYNLIIIVNLLHETQIKLFIYLLNKNCSNVV